MLVGFVAEQVESLMEEVAELRRQLKKMEAERDAFRAALDLQVRANAVERTV